MQLSLFTATPGPGPRVRAECAERCGRRAGSFWKGAYYCRDCKAAHIAALRLGYYFSYSFTRKGG